VCVDYHVATDSAMKHVVSSGTAYTSSDIDYTLKVQYLRNRSAIYIRLTSSRSKWIA